MREEFFHLAAGREQHGIEEGHSCQGSTHALEKAPDALLCYCLQACNFVQATCVLSGPPNEQQCRGFPYLAGCIQCASVQWHLAGRRLGLALQFDLYQNKTGARLTNSERLTKGSLGIEPGAP